MPTHIPEGRAVSTGNRPLKDFPGRGPPVLSGLHLGALPGGGHGHELGVRGHRLPAPQAVSGIDDLGEGAKGKSPFPMVRTNFSPILNNFWYPPIKE